MSIRMVWDSNIPSWTGNMRTTVGSILQQGAQQMAAIAQETVAVDTESLRDTIDAEEVGGSTEDFHEWSINAGNVEGGYKGGSANTGRDEGEPVDYAAAQEYGGGPGEHTPYMTPAFEAGRVQITTEMTAAIQGVQP